MELTIKDYYSVQAISNSALSIINPNQGGSPKKFKKYVLDRESDKKETPSLKNGKLIHLYVENPEEFIISDTIRPSDMLAEWVERVHDRISLTSEQVISENNAIKYVALELRNDAYSNVKKEDVIWEKFCTGLDYLKSLVEQDGKQLLSSQERTILDGCIESLKSNNTIWNMLYSKDDVTEQTKPEYEMFWDFKYKDDKTLKLKGMIDVLKIKPLEKVIQIIDFKTTSKSISDYPESFENWRTYRQLAMYGVGVKHVLLEEFSDIQDWTFEYYVIAQETFGLYENCIYKIPDEWILEGLKEMYTLLSMVVYHIEENDWVNTPDEKKYGYRLMPYVRQQNS